ncbi:hypothetical protein [Fodinicola feengrottensis]|uniref:hypothetical protein n=1 Tax=Fodinicola feengrottensis TaxID=435914 RepID=UPI0031D7714C
MALSRTKDPWASKVNANIAVRPSLGASSEAASSPNALTSSVRAEDTSYNPPYTVNCQVIPSLGGLLVIGCAGCHGASPSCGTSRISSFASADGPAGVHLGTPGGLNISIARQNCTTCADCARSRTSMTPVHSR